MAKGKRGKQRDIRRQQPEREATQAQEQSSAGESGGAVSGMPQGSSKKRERRFGHN